MPSKLSGSIYGQANKKVDTEQAYSYRNDNDDFPIIFL